MDRTTMVGIGTDRIRYYGVLTGETAQDLEIRLQCEPETTGDLLPGAQTQVVMLDSGILQTATACVRSCAGRTVVLTLEQPVRKIARRKDRRYPLTLPVHFRVANGLKNVWHTTETTDISLNGMGLRVAEGLPFPEAFEVRFTLPHCAPAADGLRWSGEREISALGHFTYNRMLGENALLAGISLLKMSPEDRNTLACFLEAQEKT